MRAGFTDGAHGVAFLVEEDGGVARHGLDQHAIRELAFEQYLGELGRHLLPGVVVDAGADAEDEIAAEKRGGQEDQVAGVCQQDGEPATALAMAPSRPTKIVTSAAETQPWLRSMR